MSHLRNNEIVKCVDGFFIMLYGKTNYDKWKELKDKVNLCSESKFVNWLLSAGEMYHEQSLLHMQEETDYNQDSSNVVDIDDGSEDIKPGPKYNDGRGGCEGGVALSALQAITDSFTSYDQQLPMHSENSTPNVPSNDRGQVLDYEASASYIPVNNKTNKFDCSVCGKTFRSRFYVEKHHLAVHMTAAGCIEGDNMATNTICSDDAEDGEVIEGEKTDEVWFDDGGYIEPPHETPPNSMDTYVKATVDGRVCFRCSLCGKLFSQPSTVMRHIRDTHYRMKNYPCPHCGKKFARRTNCKMHSNTCMGLVLPQSETYNGTAGDQETLEPEFHKYDSSLDKTSSSYQQ